MDKINFLSTTLKTVIHLISIGGLIVLFGVNRGWYLDEERQEFFRLVKIQGSVLPSDQGADKFLRDYFFNEYSLNPVAIERIQFVGTFIKDYFGKSMNAGNLIVVTKDGAKTGPLASLAEIERWAQGISSFWKWFGFTLTATGIALTVFRDVSAIRKKQERKNKGRKKQG